VLIGKKVLAVVPARGGSKGIPLKNIQPVLGVPLVTRVGQLVQQIPMIDCSVLSTDHPEIKKIGEKSGLLAPFFRPEELSGDNIGDIPVLVHALNEMEIRNKCVYDIVVLLPPTSPLRRKEHVENTIEKLVYGNYDSVWTVSETDSKFHPFKQLQINDNQLQYFDSEKGKTIVSRQQLDTLFFRNGAAYSMTRNYLMKNKNDQALPLLGQNIGFVLIDDLMVNIDYPWEFKFAEFILENNNKSES